MIEVLVTEHTYQRYGDRVAGTGLPVRLARVQPDGRGRRGRRVRPARPRSPRWRG